MSLPVYQSIQSTEGTGTSVVVTKPTGLAAGDLMVGIGVLVDNSSGTPSLPAGWTSSLAMSNADESQFKMVIGYKIADASDVSASNFTFTATASPESYSCHIIRLTTSDSFTTPVLGTAGDDDSNTSTNPTFSISFDAVVTNALLIAVFSRSGTTTGVSNYTLNGTNPTWTERYDNSASGLSIAIATAVTGTQTSFTTFEVDTGTSDSGNSMMIASFAASNNATADVGHLVVSPTLFGIPGSNTATALVGHLDASPTLNGLSAVNSSDETQWTNPDKPSTAWNNPNK